MSCFEERYRLLIESGQATQQTVEATCRVIARVEEHFGIQLDEENASMFVTHMAVTLKRLIEGQSLEKLSDEIGKELEDYPDEVSLSVELSRSLEDLLGIRIDDSEQTFIAIHLANLRNGLVSSGLY